jgi:beta-lactamase regulating signal transducer with metallopeptidase domain/TolA-binding protein
MIAALESWLAQAPWTGILVLLIDITLKGALICAVAGIATTLLRRSSAFTRNMIWAFALVGVILLPAFSLMSPLWNLPIIPQPGTLGVESITPDYAKLEQEELVGPPPPPLTGAAGAGETAGETAAFSIPWYGWGILLWMAGAFLYLCWCMASHAGLRFIIKRGRPADYEWSVLLEDLIVEQNLRREVRLLQSGQIKAAITVGILNPTIVIPSDTKQWTDQLRRLVLSHELAHVKRWDTLIETFALLATVVYWFNPLVWHAVKQLRIERERDCDNAVLSAGARPSDYAELLMNLASDLGDSAKPVWQLSTISQGSNLKDRLMSILNQKINRKRGSRRSAILTGALVLALVLPISTSGLWNVNAQEKEKKANELKEKEKALQEKQEKMKAQKAAELQEKEKASKEYKEKQKAKKAASAEKAEKVKKVKMSKEEKSAMMWQKVCENENSAACKVAKVMKQKGPDAGIKTFYKMKQADTGEYMFSEKEFNSVGYVFLYNEKVKEAIAIFELNVKEYPDSWNVYDSLGEAYMVAGKYDEARANYEVALEKNPESESSQHALQELKKKMASAK